MDQLKIALLQISPCGSLEGNLEKGIKFCRQAKKMGADIALFPEMWSCGYDIYSQPANEWMSDAVSTDSSFVDSFRYFARELDMAIGITLLETIRRMFRTATGDQQFLTVWRICRTRKVHGIRVFWKQTAAREFILQSLI